MRTIKNIVYKISKSLIVVSLSALMALAGASIIPEPVDAAKKQKPGKPASAICKPARGADIDSGPKTFDFEGHERSYLLSVPDNYKGKKAMPLIFNFHGGGGNQNSTEANTAMGQKGATRGYIVVTPSALGTPAGWNLFEDPERVDDYAFVNALIDNLKDKLCVDETHIYAAGHSNGSAFTGLLACKAPYNFSAVAMVAAFIPPEYANCPEDVTPSILSFHGTEDPGIPYEGGLVPGFTVDGEFFVPGVRDTLDAYADLYGCKQPVKEREVAANVIRHAYTKKCANRSQAILYTIVGGGHGWPNLPDFSATDAILDFFDKDKSKSKPRLLH